MNAKSTSPENFYFLDLLKSIAIYFVIIYHFSYMEIDFIQHENFFVYLNYFLTTIFSTCVPIFFFINGALLFNKSSLVLKRHFFKILQIGALIFAWGIITQLALLPIRNETMSISEMIKNIWKLKEGWVNHLWFLKAVVVIYIFFPILYTSYKEKRGHLWFFFAFVLLLTFGNTFYSNLRSVLAFFLDKNTHLIPKNHFGNFNPFYGFYGYSIGYFILGGIIFANRHFLNHRKIRIFSSITLVVSMACLFLYGIIASLSQNKIWDVVWYGYDSIFTAVNVICIFILSLSYEHQGGQIGKAIALTGRNSLGIYLTHFIVGNFLDPYYLMFNSSPSFLSNMVYAFAILFLSLGVVVSLKQLPIVKYLFKL
ncbi:MAG: acyltransferase family protein [Cyclobacteriaceae bacterium]